MKKFTIVERRSKYHSDENRMGYTVITPADQLPVATEEYPFLRVLKEIEAPTEQEAAEAFAREAIHDERWLNGYYIPNRDVTAPLVVVVVEDKPLRFGSEKERESVGRQVHWTLIDRWENAIYAYTPSHDPCHGSHGMTARPEYYSGSGPDEGYCGAAHLTRVYNGLKRDFGDEAALEFCKMVDNMEQVTATGFLLEFQHFWLCGKKARNIGASNIHIEARVDTDPDGVMIQGIGTILTALMDTRGDGMWSLNTLCIKQGFFRQVGYKSQRPERNPYTMMEDFMRF